MMRSSAQRDWTWFGRLRPNKPATQGPSREENKQISERSYLTHLLPFKIRATVNGRTKKCMKNPTKKWMDGWCKDLCSCKIWDAIKICTKIWKGKIGCWFYFVFKSHCTIFVPSRFFARAMHPLPVHIFCLIFQLLVGFFIREYGSTYGQSLHWTTSSVPITCRSGTVFPSQSWFPSDS